MPPRSAKKVPVKKPSPRVKKPAASPKVDEEVLPSVAEAEQQPVAAEEEKVEVEEEKPVEEKVVEPAPSETEAPAAEEAAGSAAEEGKDAGAEHTEEPEEEAEDDDMEDPEEAEEGDDEPEEEAEDADTAQPADDGEAADGEPEEEDESGSDDEANEFEEEPTLDAEHLKERKKQKEHEIFIGGLNKQTTEEDLKEVFAAYGEIQSARIVRAQLSKKSKGFAFIRYANEEQAKKALSELQDGVEINGKRVGVSTSMDNDTLYLGNICKTWTKSQLLEALKGFGVEHIDSMSLPDDPNEEGKILGYAFLEFPSHSEAMEALKRLKQPDAVLGCDRSARVAFARSPVNVSEEALAKVKTVYMENIPSSWDEEKVREVCKSYGEIENVLLSRNFSKKKKRKDFGFVTFTSRENALACIEGIKNAEVGEGEVKINANLARPASKSRFSRKGAYGGFLVKKNKNEVEQSKKNGETKGTPGKGKTVKNTPGAKGNKPSRVVGNQRNQKGAPPVAGKRKGKNFNTETRPFKKPRGNAYSRPPPRYEAPPPAYRAHAYRGTSRSYHSTDMQPHAGLVPGGKQGNPYGYAQSRYDIPPRSAPYAPGPGRHHLYNAPPSYNAYEAGYPYPGSGSYPPYQRPYY